MIEEVVVQDVTETTKHWKSTKSVAFRWTFVHYSYGCATKFRKTESGKSV